MSGDVIARGVFEMVGDSTSLEATLAKAEAAARRTEQTIVRHAGGASAAVAGIGKGAGEGADGMDAASKRFVASIEREIASLTLSRAEFRKWEAERKGVDQAVYQPLVKQLEEAAKAQDALRTRNQITAQSLNHVGVSAGQTAAALRQLPAQFTDIFTSLASGQQPLLVFLQQGGQIKDSFGGMGNAARALVGAISPVTAGLVGIGVAVGGLAAAYAAGSSEADAYRKALVLTGNAAGTTAQQLAGSALAVSASVGTQAKAAEVLAALATSGRVAARDIELLAEAAIRLEREGGPAVAETVRQFAELGKNPTKAAAALNESTRFLTGAIYEQIKALEQQGKVAEAAALAQTTYSNTAIERSKALEKQLGVVERSWRAIKDAAAGAVDATLNIGRPKVGLGAASSNEDERNVANLARYRTELERLVASGTTATTEIEALRKGIARLTELTEPLREVDRLIARFGTSAATSAAAAQAADAAQKFSDLADKLKTPAQQLREQVDLYRTIGAAANKSATEIAAVVARVTALSQANSLAVAATQARIGAQAAVEAEQVQARISELQHQAAMGLINEYELIDRVAEVNVKASKANELRIAAQIDAARQLPNSYAQVLQLEGQLQAALEKTAELENQQTRSLEALQRRRRLAAEAVYRAERDAAESEFAVAVANTDKQYDDASRAVGRYAEGLQDAAYAHRVEMQASVQGEREREVMLKRLQIELKLRQQIRDIEMLPAFTDEQRQRRSDLVEQAKEDARRASEQVAQQVNETFDARVFVSLRDGLTDAILEGGKGGAQKLQDLFKQLVLRPVVQAGVNGLLGSLGLGGSAASSTGWLSQAAGVASVYNGLSSGAGLLGSLGTSLFGSNAAYGLAIGTTNVAAGSQAAMLAAQTADFGAAGFAATSGAAGGAGAGLSSALAAAGPYIAAAAAIYSIAKSLDSSGTPHFGGYASFNNDGTRNATYGMGESNRKAEYDQLVAGIIKPVGSALNSLVDTFKLGAHFATAGTFKAEAAGKDGGWGIVQLLQAGGVNVTRRADGTLSSDPTKAFEDYTKLLGSSVREAIDSLDLPGWADGVLAQLDESAKTEDILATIGQIVQTEKELNLLAADFLRLGGVFSRISGASEDVQMQLAGLFGGVQQLGQATSGYYQNYYSEAEKFTISTRQVSDALAQVGLVAPDTRDAFRALVDAQDPLTESGRQALAALLGVQQAFADLHPAVMAVADASQDASAASLAAAEAARAAAEVQRERQGIEVELLRLQGDTQALRERELAALDPSNRALKEQVYALQDAAAAQQAYLQVTQEAAQANQRAIQDMAAAAQQVVQAQTEVRGALQAIDDYGQGIRDSIAQTEAALEELRTRAAANVASSSDRVAQALRGLSDAADGAAAQVAQTAEALDAAKAQRVAAATAIEAALDQQQGAIDGAREGLRAALQGMADAATAAADRITQAERAVETAKAQRTSSITSIAAEVTRQQGAVDAARDGLRAALQGMADAATAAADRIVQAEQAVQAARNERGTAASAIAGLLDQQRGTVSGARGGVQSALAQLQGNVDATAAARAAARTAITTALVGAEQAHTQALARLTELQGQAADHTADLAAQMGRLSASITDYLTELTTSSAALANRPDVARAEFDRIAAQAQAGDATAAAQLVDSAKRVIEASRDGAASGAEFDATVRRVRQVLASVGSVAAAAAGAAPSASSNEQAIADALKAVSDSQFEVERLRAIAIEAGASLTAEKTDLLAVWRSAQDAALAAEQAYADATTRAHALGIDEVTQAGAFAQALAVFTGAQTELEAMLGRVSAAGVDLTLADSRDALQKALDDYKTANTAVTTAEAAYAVAVQVSTTAADSLAAAMAAAAAAGVTLAPPLGSFAQAMSVFNAASVQLESTLGRIGGVGIDLAGADTRDPLQKLLDDYKAANTAVTTAEAAYAVAVQGSTTAADALAAALTSAAAAGVSLTPAADAFGQALAAFNAARADLDAMNTAFAGVDLSWADKTSPVEKLVNDYNAATTAINTAQTAYETAVSNSAAAAESLTSAMTLAADAGVALNTNTGTLASEFAAALNELSAARAALAVVGSPAVAPDLLTQYGTLQTKLTGLNADLATFNERVNGLDFSGLADLDPLGTLLQTYSGAVSTLLEAVDKQQTLGATGQFVDIGGGFQRYSSTGGAVGIVNAAGAVTVFGKDGRTFGLSAIQEYVAQLMAANDWRTIYNEAVSFGMSSADLDRFANGAGTPTLAWARSLGLPAFAAGGDHVGGLRLVGEFGPEIEATGAARYFDSAQTQRMLRGDGDTTAAEVRALRAEVIALRQEMAAGNTAIAGNTLRTTKVLERASAPNGIYTTAAP